MAIRPEQTLSQVNAMSDALIKETEEFLDAWLLKNYDGSKSTITMPKRLNEREQEALKARYVAAGWIARWESKGLEQFFELKPA
jgi:hypothetical protein